MGEISLRRLRQSQQIQELVRGRTPSPLQMIQPLFVVEGLNQREELPGMPQVYRDTESSALSQIERDLRVGVSKFLLFFVPKEKGSVDFRFDFGARQIEKIKKEFGSSVFLGSDVCLCSSTEHGHCGILNAQGDHVENEKTVSTLCQAAISYAQAGCDCIAPSDMMDGRIGAIRKNLDQKGHRRTLIMSYAVKFRSQFYGPFRVAADSAPKNENKLKDRSTYQLDPTRLDDALLCAERDAREGADILMVKPGLPYLDVLKTVSEQVKLPWAVYQVSGEYAAISLLSQAGLTNEQKAHEELWTAYVRAGASIIITYAARLAHQWIQ